MLEFFEHLKNGKFMMPVCTSCGNKTWPPSHHCPRCLSKTSLKKTQTIGILIEFTSSHVKGKEGVFGFVEISGIKLVGSFGNRQLKEGMKVRMTRCGIGSDGTAFYSFVPA